MLAFFLPSIATSIYFYQTENKKNDKNLPENNEKPTGATTVDILSEKGKDYPQGDMTKEDKGVSRFSWKEGLTLLKSHLMAAFSNQIVRLWSIWWILLHGGFYLIYSYNQPLWHFIEPDRTDVYNGLTETGMTLVGALGSLLAAKLSQEFIEKWALSIVVICSMGLGSFSIVAGLTSSVFVSYGMYIALGALYHFMITVTR